MTDISNAIPQLQCSRCHHLVFTLSGGLCRHCVAADLNGKPPVQLDLTDSAIREMIEFHHTPEDTWAMGGALMRVHCTQCGFDWPCPPTESLRAHKKENPDDDG